MVAESYQIISEGQSIKIDITEDRRYIVNLRQFSAATLAAIKELKQKIISQLEMPSEKMASFEQRRKFKEEIKKVTEIVIKDEFKEISSEDKTYIVSDMARTMMGLGKIDILLSDDQLEEINVVSCFEPIRVYHKKHGWLETSLQMISENETKEIANKIARMVGKQISELTPLLDAHLMTGDRVNAILKPVTSKGNSITIRKFAREPWTITHLIKNKTCSAELFALLWMAMQYESSILISGGTGSGKTSMLNVMMPFIPPNHRIVSIEDTRELQLPRFLYWEPMVTREPNQEGRGGIDAYMLMINALRMRPDRIILGEMRKKDVAEVFFEALHTGHSVYGTIHANNSEETVERLVHPPIGISPILVNGIDLNIVMFRDRKRNIRRVAQVAEFIKKTNEDGSIQVTDNPIYQWDGVKDEILPNNKSKVFLEKLKLTTGLTDRDIENDIAEKEEILNFMVKNNITRIDEVGKIMDAYYDKDKKEKSLKKVMNASKKQEI